MSRERKQKHTKKSSEVKRLIDEAAEMLSEELARSIVEKYIPKKEDGTADLNAPVDEETKLAIAQEVYDALENKILELQEELQKRTAELEAGISSPPLKVVLGCIEDKKGLIRLASELGLRGNQKYKKAELAERIANTLLNPRVMRSRINGLSDETIKLFEKICDSPANHYAITGWAEQCAAERLEDLYYLFWLKDDRTVEIPEEVESVYRTINTPEFQQERSERAWLDACLNLIPIYYGRIPFAQFYRLYRKGGCKNREELRTWLLNQPVLTAEVLFRDQELIYIDVLEENETVKELEEWQEGKAFYIPPREEVMEIYDLMYPASQKECRELKEYLEKTLKLAEAEASGETILVWRKLSMGHEPIDVMQDLISEQDLVFDTKDEVSGLAQRIFTLNNRTRMMIHRGATPDEMAAGRQNALFGRDGTFPTIVPGSSLAAQMLKQGQKEIEKMGFTVDLDSTAVDMNKAFPSATPGAADARPKKIYPNDPCPCGSGKKYKHCCGRK